MWKDTGGDTAMDETINKKAQSDYDEVERPFHYNTGDGIECIDYIKQVLKVDGFIAYCRGNVHKYLHRADYKGNPTQDLEKARYYLDKAIESMKEKYE